LRISWSSSPTLCRHSLLPTNNNKIEMKNENLDEQLIQYPSGGLPC